MENKFTINRRHALLGMGAAMLGGTATAHAALKEAQPAPDIAQQSLDEQLRKDLTPREYSEEGVPVLLACEDLRSKAAATTPYNASLAHQMHANGDAMLRIRPDVKADDVALVMEVLAARDFRNAGAAAEPAPATTNFTTAFEELTHTFAAHPVIRAVNFHNTSRAQAAAYERQLAEYGKHFSSVTQEDLDRYLTTGIWHKSKPGLIVSVFEGYRNSYDVLAPLIEKYNFVGWFWMITSFLNCPIADQQNYAEHHDIDMLTHEYPDKRYALTWEELRALDKKHVICSHTRNHTLLASLPPDVQRQEVIGSQEDFVKNLGHPVRAFVSLTGPQFGENAAIDKLIVEAGYDTVFSNFRVQRIR